MGPGRHTIVNRPTNDALRDQIIDLTTTKRTQILSVMIEGGCGHIFQVVDLKFMRANDGLTFTGLMANGSSLVLVKGFLPNNSNGGWIALDI